MTNDFLCNGFLEGWNKEVEKRLIHREVFLKMYIDNTRQYRLEADRPTMVKLMTTESFYSTVESLINDYYKRQDNDLIYKFLESIVADYFRKSGIYDGRDRVLEAKIRALREKRMISRIEMMKLFFKK